MTGDIPAARLPGAVRARSPGRAGEMSRGDLQGFGFHRNAVGTGAIALLLGILLLLAAGPARAQCVGTTCTVANATDLVSALTTVDNNPGSSYVINITGTITLTAGTTLPALTSTSTVIINGNSHTLDGGSVQRGFFVYQGTVADQRSDHPEHDRQGGAGGIDRRRGCAGSAVPCSSPAAPAVTVSNVTLGSATRPTVARAASAAVAGCRRRRRHGRQRRQRAQRPAVAASDLGADGGRRSLLASTPALPGNRRRARRVAVPVSGAAPAPVAPTAAAAAAARPAPAAAVSAAGPPTATRVGPAASAVAAAAASPASWPGPAASVAAAAAPAPSFSAATGGFGGGGGGGGGPRPQCRRLQRRLRRRCRWHWQQRLLR